MIDAPQGPPDDPGNLNNGAYQALAMMAMAIAEADGVVLCVFRGSRGNGVSVVTAPGSDIRDLVPKLLRALADGIEENPQWGAER